MKGETKTTIYYCITFCIVACIVSCATSFMLAPVVQQHTQRQQQATENLKNFIDYIEYRDYMWGNSNVTCERINDNYIKQTRFFPPTGEILETKIIYEPKGVISNE